MNLNYLVVVSTLLVGITDLFATPRTSENYVIITDTADSAGARTSSVAYTHDGSLGGVTGLSTVASTAQVAKAGYIGQLYDVAALQLSATPATIDEVGTRQLSACLLFDDATTLALAANALAWSVQSGPLTGIDANGLATASTVFQNTLATAQILYNGNSASLDLNVLDTLLDNFGTYAADGLDDDWQVQYFGQDNSTAAPLQDPDGDGQNNLFEFTVGAVPTDRASIFTVNFGIPIGQPSQRSIVFSPLIEGRTYTVKTSTTLSSWVDLSGGHTVTDNGSVRTVTDLNATGTCKFYRVEITRP